MLTGESVSDIKDLIKYCVILHNFIEIFYKEFVKLGTNFIKTLHTPYLMRMCREKSSGWTLLDEEFWLYRVNDVGKYHFCAQPQ